jgi:hypothetical protein
VIWPASRPREDRHGGPVRTPGQEGKVSFTEAREIRVVSLKGAACYESGHPLVIEGVEIHLPQAGELKRKIGACAVCQSDVHVIWGC